jgi:hypothetical protein
MRLAVVHDIAAFAAQLAVAAGKQLQLSSSRSSSSSATTPAAQLAPSGLQDSPEFLALTLLVLQGQLTAAEAGIFAEPAQVQQQQQHCSHELFAALLEAEMEDYCSGVQVLMYPLRPLGRHILFSWVAAPCWQQHSSDECILHVLLLLQPLLQAWEDRNAFDSAAPAAAAADRGLDSSLLLLWELPVVLLQLAVGAWQRGEVVRAAFINSKSGRVRTAVRRRVCCCCSGCSWPSSTSAARKPHHRHHRHLLQLLLLVRLLLLQLAALLLHLLQLATIQRSQCQRHAAQKQRCVRCCLRCWQLSQTLDTTGTARSVIWRRP